MDTSRYTSAYIKAVSCALIAAIALGALTPVSKALMVTLHPLHVAALLCWGAGISAAIALALRTVVKHPRTTKALTKRNLPLVLVMLFINAVAIVVFAYGVNNTQAADSTLLTSFIVVAASVFSLIAFKVRMGIKAVASSLLICAACALLCFDGNGQFSFQPESLLVLTACLLWGIEASCARLLTNHDPFLLIAANGITGGLVASVLSIALHGVPVIPPVSVAEALIAGALLLGLGVLCTVYALRSLGPSRASNFFAAAPYLGAAIAWFMFGQAPEPLYFGALAFMAVGTWLSFEDTSYEDDERARMQDQEINAEHLQMDTNGAPTENIQVARAYASAKCSLMR